MTTSTTTQGSPVADWRPARRFPETYPGACPPGHYLLAGDRVLPLTSTADGGYAVGDEPLDALLARRGLPTLAQRYAVLAYGANRNPGTLHLKFTHYRYATPAGGSVVPVLRATLADADVVAGGIHGQGYLYGELLLHAPATRGTRLDVHVLFLDADQLRVMHDSEGVRDGTYAVGRIPGVHVAGLADPIAPLGYLANLPVWSSPALGAPLAFAGVRCRDRRLPAMTTPQMLAHVLHQCGLRDEIRAATALADDDHLADELIKFLNGQWWYTFHTGADPIPGYRRVLDALRAAMRRDVVVTGTRERLADLGLLLDTEQAYRPDPRHTLLALTG
ncbi:hypothetical protein [Micromonospora sp. SH-82]|uniref:hypothetical protein n=1 Tax=Micromonospora sp. SH-82 TaxID=3132938 RepID=UPI003EBADEE7